MIFFRTNRFFFRLLQTLFALLFFLYCGFAASQRQNRTPYIRPGRKEIARELKESGRLAGKHREEMVCTRQKIEIEVYSDYSCRIAETLEFFLKKKLDAFPLPLPKPCYVEQFFPDGSYRDANDPAKLFLPADSLFILKFSRTLPPRKPGEFFLEIFLDRTFSVERTVLTIASAREVKIFHGMTPPCMGRLPLMRKLGKNAYMLDPLSPQKSERADERVRFYASALPSWQKLGDHLLAEKKKNAGPLPPLPPAVSGGKEKLSPGEKVKRLFHEAKKREGKEKAYILSQWLVSSGIRACPAVGKKERRNIHMDVACSFFSCDLVRIAEQKGFRSGLWLDLSAEEPGKVLSGEERFPVLLLREGASEILFFTPGK
ncbi:MAG: hypothetical protein J6331_00010 [Lentisphaeria bacterium]|nr:hypothetical protein [Lentisphaeria bacterium]